MHYIYKHQRLMDLSTKESDITNNHKGIISNQCDNHGIIMAICNQLDSCVPISRQSHAAMVSMWHRRFLLLLAVAALRSSTVSASFPLPFLSGPEFGNVEAPVWSMMSSGILLANLVGDFNIFQT